jgi:hypothetical protein
VFLCWMDERYYTFPLSPSLLVDMAFKSHWTGRKSLTIKWVLLGSIFMFSNFYRVSSHYETCGALANFMQRSINTNWIENRTMLVLIIIIGSAHLLLL